MRDYGVPGLRAIDRMDQRIFAAVQPGEEVRCQPGFGNLFYECKSRLLKEGKITRSSGKYYRAFTTAEALQ